MLGSQVHPRDTGVEATSLAHRVKLATFGVFHSMRERDAGHRITKANQLWRLMLLCVDAVQVVVLALNPAFGWSSSLLGWMNDFSLMELLLPDRDPALFNLVSSLVLVVVLAAIADAAYVAYMFKNSNFQHLWPLKLLRFMVSILVTAGFVPTFGILVTPLSCAKMQAYNGDDFECWGAHRVVSLVLSLGTLCLYLPFGLASSLVFHESDGNSTAITAKVCGREAMFGTMAKLLAVVGGLLADSYPVLVACSMVCSYLLLGIYVATTLPFFNRYMNQFRVSASFLVAFLSCGSVILSTAKPSSPGTFSAIWIGLSLFVIAGASLLPRLRMKMLRDKLMAMRPRMLEELDEKHNNVPTRWKTHRGSQRYVEKGTMPHRRRALRVSIKEMAGRVRNAHFRQARLPLGMIDEVLENEIAEDKTVFDGMSAYEVELIVRCELNMPGNKDRRRRKFGANRIVPTTQAVEHAMWLFVQAIEEFCDDPVDVASVKIEYARFLQVFTADVNLATAALESAKKEQPSIEGEFEVFSRCRGLQQKRQSQNLGAERDMNLIALVEYGKRLNRAITAHDAALDYQLKLVNTVSRHRGRIELDDDAMAERLGGYVQAMRDSVTAANRLYRRLLTTHPNAPHLGAIYARFCTDLMNDEQLAAQFSTDETGTANGSQAGSKAGSAHGSKLGSDARFSGKHTVGSSRIGVSLRTFMPKTRTKEVSFLETQFRAGTVVLLIIAAAIFATTHALLTTTSREVGAIGTAGLQRKMIVSAAYYARSMSLDGMQQETVDAMLSDMALFKEILHEVHTDGSQRAEVLDQWHEPQIGVEAYAGNGTWYQQDINLYDLSIRVIADMQQLSVEGLGSNYSENTHWRFVMDNAVTKGFPAFRHLLSLLEDSIKAHALEYSEIQGGLVLALVIVLFILGHFVFRRALSRVVIIKRAVLEIATALSAEQLAGLIQRAKNGKAFVAKARVKVAGAVDPSHDPEASNTERAGPAGRRFSTGTASAKAPSALVTGKGDLVQLPAYMKNVSRQQAGFEVTASVDGSVDSERVRSDSAMSHDSHVTFSVPGHTMSFGPDVPGGSSGRVIVAGNDDSDDSANEILNLQSKLSSHSADSASPQNETVNPVAAEASLNSPRRNECVNPVAAPAPATDAPSTTVGDVADSGVGAEEASTGPSSPRDGTLAASTAQPAATAVAATDDGADTCETDHDSKGADDADVHSDVEGEGNDSDERGLNAHIDSTANLFAVWAESTATSNLMLGGDSSRSAMSLPPLAQELVQETTTLVAVDEGNEDRHDSASLASSGQSASPRNSSQGIVPIEATAFGGARDDAAHSIIPETVVRESDGAVVEVPDLEDIMNATPGAVVLADSQGTIMYANEHFTRMLGYSRKAAVGSSLALFVPSESIKALQDMIRRLVVTGSVSNGTSEYKDGQGTQVDVLSNMGEAVPMLLNVNRTQFGGRYWVVLDMQDLRNHIQVHDDGDGDDAQLTQAHHASTLLVRQVISALLLVGLLQCVNVVVGFVGLEEIGGRSTEISIAGIQRTYAHLLTFQGREAVIGDNQLWSSAQATQLMSETMATYDIVRFGLLFGDDALSLPGSARRNPGIDAIQFGSVDGHSIKHGVVSLTQRFTRAVRDIIRDFGESSMAQGPEIDKLSNVEPLTTLIAADHGEMFVDLAKSVSMYREDSETTAAGIQTTNIIISGVHICLVCMLYLVVFRRMVKVLVRQAARSEGMLLALPEDMATTPKLQKYFVRVAQ